MGHISRGLDKEEDISVSIRLRRGSRRALKVNFARKAGSSPRKSGHFYGETMGKGENNLPGINQTAGFGLMRSEQKSPERNRGMRR